MIWKDLELFLACLALNAQHPPPWPCPVFPKRPMCDIRAGSLPPLRCALPAGPASGDAGEGGGQAAPPALLPASPPADPILRHRFFSAELLRERWGCAPPGPSGSRSPRPSLSADTSGSRCRPSPRHAGQTQRGRRRECERLIRPAVGWRGVCFVPL